MNVYLKTGIFAVAGTALICGVISLAAPSVLDTRQAVHQVAASGLPPQAGCDDQTTLRVAKDLQEHPNQWKQGEYRLTKGGGWFKDPAISIWTANADYGLDFTTGRFGDAMKYPFTDQCRAYLYSITSHFQQIRANAQVNALRQQIAQATKGD